MNTKYLGKVNATNKARRVPICFCVDISNSMNDIVEGLQYCKSLGKSDFIDGEKCNYFDTCGDKRVKTRMDKLIEGLHNFYEAIKEDDMACDSCEAEIITFADTPAIFDEFSPIDEKKELTLSGQGNYTNMTPALQLALDTLERQKQMYKEYRIPYCQPWLVLFTDGQPTDDITYIAKTLVDKQMDKKLTVYICPLTNDEGAKNILKTLVSSSYGVLSEFIPCDDPKKISHFFTFLAKSVSVASGGGKPNIFKDAPEGW